MSCGIAIGGIERTGFGLSSITVSAQSYLAFIFGYFSGDMSEYGFLVSTERSTFGFLVCK